MDLNLCQPNVVNDPSVVSSLHVSPEGGSDNSDGSKEGSVPKKGGWLKKEGGQFQKRVLNSKIEMF